MGDLYVQVKSLSPAEASVKEPLRRKVSLLALMWVVNSEWMSNYVDRKEFDFSVD